MEFELITDKNLPPQIIVTDNGIGLTIDEVHEFLSVIGASSKKDELLQKKKDFIGQFGIGLLSCFVIADEIVMISQSLKTSNAVEWRGKGDGTYSVRTLDQQLSTGTRIFLTAKPEQAQYFQKTNLIHLIKKYGNFLPYPVLFSEKDSKPKRLNKSEFPWEKQRASKPELISFGESFFDIKVIDCIPLYADASNSAGYAFIGMASNSLSVQNHSVYLNRMFLSDKVDNLLPEWVFFAKCVINSTGLRPTASREAFFEDEVLIKTKGQLGACIINYLHSLKTTDPVLLNKIISRHETAIKLAATSSDEFFDNIYDLIPFETNYGNKTFKDIAGTGREIRYVPDIDEFKKISGIAFNQSIEVDIKEALKRAQPILTGKKTCTHIPKDTYTNFITPLLVQKQNDLASDFAEKLEKTLKRSKYGGDFTNIYPLILYHCVHARMSSALKLFEKYFGDVFIAKAPDRKFNFYCAAINMLTRVEKTTIKLKLPQNFILFNKDNVYEVSALTGWLERNE